jgi:hypothetical protein
LCCLLYFTYLFFIISLVSFRSLLKSSLYSFSCFCALLIFLFVFFDIWVGFLFYCCAGGGTLQHLQKFLQCIKYTIL